MAIINNHTPLHAVASSNSSVNYRKINWFHNWCQTQKYSFRSHYRRYLRLEFCINIIFGKAHNIIPYKTGSIDHTESIYSAGEVFTSIFDLLTAWLTRQQFDCLCFVGARSALAWRGGEMRRLSWEQREHTNRFVRQLTTLLLPFLKVLSRKIFLNLTTTMSKCLKVKFRLK